MENPATDPVDRSSTAKRADAASSSGEMHPSLSDVLRSHSSSTRGPNAAEMVSHIPLPASTDDSPTVITQAGKLNVPPPPPPPHVVGDAHSIAGRRLGHFELIEAIGAGGMAAVLKARDLDLGRVVALKILPPESALDLESVTRFKQEARAAAKLDHDNVARVYFCGEDQGLHFIAFEFVEGITLRQTIDWRGPVGAGDCVRFMIQVAAGLAHAAERGVVHRDIKPSNILITPDGRAKIVDMGLARHLESQSVNGGVTQSGVTLGTFDYISPEQALDPREADVRSDIYSLGCTFYHALTGRPPVPEGTAAKKLYAHQHIDPLDPRELNAAIPDELAAVLARMMAKDPKKRYQTPAELIAHLKAIAERLRISLDTVATDAMVLAVMADDRVLPRVPRLRLSWVAATAAVVAAIVAVAVAASGPDLASTLPWWAKGQTVSTPDGSNYSDGGAQAKLPGIPLEERAVATAEELAVALADPNASRVRLAPGTYDLTKLDKPVSFSGPKLELIGSVTPATIVRVAAPAGKRSETTGTLTVSASTLLIRGIRFEIATPAEMPEPTGDFTGLLLLDSVRIDLQDCQFVPDREARKSGVIAASVGTGEPRVKLTRCLFAPGWIGLRVPSRASLEVEDSGFAPNLAAIQVFHEAEEATEPKSRVASIGLDRSTFMLDSNSAAIDVEESATSDVRVTAGYCVFAPANGTSVEPKVPGGMEPQTLGVVVRNTKKSRGAKLIATAERRNAYYAVAQTSSVAKASGFEESGWVKLDRRPWDSSSGLLAAFGTAEPWAAFRLTLAGPGADAAIFPEKDKSLGVIGVQFHDAQEGVRRTYASAPIWPPSASTAAEITTRIWWPNAGDAVLKPHREFSDLVTLLREARSGDTILIRHDGPLVMEQHTIQPLKGTPDRSEFHLTFKPETKDLKPILIPAWANDIDLSIFRVKEGRVSFEDLNFWVKPERPKYQEQICAVTLVAGRSCEFKNCTFTLEEEEGKIASAVSLAETREMKMDGPAMRSIPEVKFAGCLIRGKGRAVSVPVSRPFALEMTQCITGLNGPVVFAKNAGRDVSASVGSTIHLSRVTALLGGPFLELQGGSFGTMKNSGLVPTAISAERCVFASVPGAGQPMIEIAGTEMDRLDPKAILKWTSTEANRFANFDQIAPVVVKPDLNTTQSWKWSEWIQFAREAGNPVGKMTFKNEPDDLKDLANLKPGDAEVKSVDLPDAKPSDAGADPEKVAGGPVEKAGQIPDEQ